MNIADPRNGAVDHTPVVRRDIDCGTRYCSSSYRHGGQDAHENVLEPDVSSFPKPWALASATKKEPLSAYIYRAQESIQAS